MNNSQPLRFQGCCDKKPSFQKIKNSRQEKDSFDYKKAYENSQAQLKHLGRKYEVLCNVCALGMNPKFK